jgi:transposase
MMGPYPNELRWRVVDEHLRGKGTLVEVAEQFGVSRGFVRDMVAQYRRTGSVAPRPHGGGRHKLGSKGEAKLSALVEADPDATLDELRARLRRSRRIEMTRSGICRALQRLDLPRKKSRSVRPNRTGRMFRRRAQRSSAACVAGTRSGTFLSMNSVSILR